MAPSIEILVPPSKMISRGADLVAALRSGFPQARVTEKYEGNSDWLWLYGVGAPDRDKARKHQVKTGRHVWLWDLSYFDRRNYMRCSIDHDHPQQWLDKTQEESRRWDSLGISLRDDYDPKGPIILVGLGSKSRQYLNDIDWERLRLITLRKRFPDHQIIYRPKPGSGAPMNLACKIDATSTIEQLLKGASLVSCRHSNVACDAAVAGVPFECDDGAAMWLQAKPFTPENRLEFLHRLAWWQWKPSEVREAWRFAQQVVTA